MPLPGAPSGGQPGPAPPALSPPHPALALTQTALAFLKRDFLIAASYKTAFVADTVGILFKVTTFRYLSAIFGDRAAPSLAAYGGDYFAFLIVGLALMDFVHTSLKTFTTSIRDSQLTGTLEVVLLSPIKLSHMILFSSLWAYVFTTLRFLVYLVFGSVLFSLDLHRANVLGGVVVLLLSILSFAPLGIITATVIMVFKKGAWFATLVSGLSVLLGGVVYPLEVLPPPVARLGAFVPMSYCTNAMRQTLLNGLSLVDLGRDVLALIAFGAILLPLSLVLFQIAVTRTKKLGTLTQY
jgi:ABC-2 type transport system permease protein